jgi:NADPH2:quinone reductase
MRRIVCRKLSGIEDLELEVDAAPAVLTSKDVRIDVHACGVNYPDTLIVQGKYQFKPELPFAPGGEVAGVIREVGKDVHHLKTGQRVAALVIHGGFADELVVAAERVVPIPDEMSFHIAAGFLITYGTTIYALQQRARLTSGATALILGAAGGVGLTAVEVAHAMGATVIAAASTAEKLELTRTYGATHTINYTTEDLKKVTKRLTNGRGVDVVYDPVGGDYTEKALRAMAWGGRHLVVGFASGEIPAIRANLLLLKGCEAVGVFWGDFVEREPAKSAANIQQLFQWYREGKLRPHVHGVWPLTRAPDALRALQNREVRGKLVLDTRA